MAKNSDSIVNGRAVMYLYRAPSVKSVLLFNIIKEVKVEAVLSRGILFSAFVRNVI